MKFKTILITVIISFGICIKIAFSSDIIDDISLAFKNGDVNNISKYFNSDVELDVLEKNNIYTSTQAKLILNDFLTKNKPKSFKLLHKVTSRPDYKFAVIELVTNKGIYRISFELKNIKNKYFISHIRIEVNN